MPGSRRGETARLAEAVRAHRRLLVLTGAGCSTGSGIADYRDGDGNWKRSPPIELSAFLSSDHVRRRYWARSLVGWRSFSRARPGPTHRALVRLEQAGFVHGIVTQNVDGLHQAAGSHAVIDLHGRNDQVVCVGCGERADRERFQGELVRTNPGFDRLDAAAAPDGDADLERADLAGFEVPSCPHCGGVVKPDVVFFGDSVPRERVARAYRALEAADALLAVGTSLMVYSAFRFCRAAAETGKPILIVNRGRTRADDLAACKVAADCARVLERLLARLEPLGPAL